MKKEFPRPELTEMGAKGHLKAWSEIGDYAGQVRLEAALQRCIAECQFFPKVEDVEARLPAADAVLRGVADEQCPECNGSGWQPVTEGAYRAVKRCHCWRKELRSA